MPGNGPYAARTGLFVACFIRLTSIYLRLHHVDDYAILRVDAAHNDPLSHQNAQGRHNIAPRDVTTVIHRISSMRFNPLFASENPRLARLAHCEGNEIPG